MLLKKQSNCSLMRNLTFSITKACLIIFMTGAAANVNAGVVKGSIRDIQSAEALTGATVMASGLNYGTAADIDGNYVLDLPSGVYTLTVRYVGYKPIIKAGVKVPDTGDVLVDFLMESDAQTLGEVTVIATASRNTEAAQVQEQRSSLVVQTGVSAQQIARTQDKNASEVIRRVPGVSVIDDKFVMVRGLSQRYNNVWLNGGAVPSSEADTRAFSFDILPGSQLDNMVIVKSQAPEFPADFTGGFIMVNTKQQPVGGGFDISAELGYNDRTHFRSFKYAKGCAMDWLGFGSAGRMPDAGMTGRLNAYPGYENSSQPRLDPLNNGLNNDWTLRTKHPLADLKLALSYNHTWVADGGESYGLLAAMNYSNSYKTLTDMENSLYGPYDVSNDKAVALRKATDNQYSKNVRLGAMLNLSFRPRYNRHFFEWKNIFNRLAKDRFSERSGFNAQPDSIQNMEYFYSSRTTYNTQFTGRHTFDSDRIDWSVGYAYANRVLPDRRLIERTDRTEQAMGIYRISREFTRLDEHIASANANYKRDFDFGTFCPSLKTGLYGEYRARTYRAREFQYGWQPDNALPQGFIFDDDVPGHVLVDDNYGPDKLYLYEEVNYLNNYEGNQTLLAAYAGINLPFGALNIYAGARYEYNRQVLRMNTHQYEESLHSTNYDNSDLFPSVNLTYKLADCHQLRAAYGKSVNRPEFRELSTSVYYDFDLGSSVMGNAELQSAYIDNIDLRYEWYPSGGEQVSVGLFYKHFKHPIEWTYTVAGGTDLIYSFINAEGANNYGVELDIRKSLDFIGLCDFSLSFNGALIKSKVQFAEGTNNIDRPMQGQSPYLVNTGLFYNNEGNGWSAAVLYNRIGKRITGVGNRYGTGADGTAKNIPNSYEMPRNSIDLSVSKQLGSWVLKAAVRDLLAEQCLFKQFEEVSIDGEQRTIEEVTRSFKLGRTFSLAVSYNF